MPVIASIDASYLLEIDEVSVIEDEIPSGRKERASMIGLHSYKEITAGKA